MTHLFRCWRVAVLFLLGLGLVALIAPQQLSVTLYKFVLISGAGYVGYWLDRSLFPYARPTAFLRYAEPNSRAGYSPSEHQDASNTAAGHVFATAMIRRAIVVAACVIAAAIGL